MKRKIQFQGVKYKIQYSTRFEGDAESIFWEIDEVKFDNIEIYLSIRNSWLDVYENKK